MSGQQCLIDQERLRVTGTEKCSSGVSSMNVGVDFFFQRNFSGVVRTDNRDVRIGSEKAETVIADCALRTLAKKEEEREATEKDGYKDLKSVGIKSWREEIKDNHRIVEVEDLWYYQSVWQAGYENRYGLCDWSRLLRFWDRVLQGSTK